MEHKKSWDWNSESKEEYNKLQYSKKDWKMSPETIAREMSDIKDEIATLEDRYARKQRELMSLMENAENKLVTFFKNGRRFTAKLVEGTRTVVNEDNLKKLIPASVWETILISKVDQTKLSRAITAGEIDAEVVSEAVAIVPSSPYWRFTDKGDKDDNIKPIS